MDAKTWVVIAVVIIGAVIYFINARRLRKSNQQKIKAQEDQSEKLFHMYQNIEDLMDSFEEYVEEVRSSIHGEIETIRKERQELEALMVQAREIATVSREIKPRHQKPLIIKTIHEEDMPKQPPREEKPAVVDIKQGRAQRIVEMRKNGKPADQIAKELGISMGEVNMSIGLFDK